jgi:hypothetical protein
MMIRIQIPPEGDRPALESDKQAVRNGEDDIENHDPADDPDVPAINSDTKKEETDADFEGCCRQGVEDFAEEPVLFARVSQYCSHQLKLSKN